MSLFTYLCKNSIIRKVQKTVILTTKQLPIAKNRTVLIHSYWEISFFSTTNCDAMSPPPIKAPKIQVKTKSSYLFYIYINSPLSSVNCILLKSDNHFSKKNSGLDK